MEEVMSLLEQWQRFAAQARRYHLTIYDYTNELCVRDHLARRASDLERVGAQERLNTADELLRASTREISHRLPGSASSHEWWWRRIPLDPRDELAEDLKGEGIT
jgi:hypothetical protein